MTMRIPLLLCIVPLLVGACGGSEPSDRPTSTSTPVGRAGAPAGQPAASATPDGRPVEITANDQMKFDVVEIRAKRGERLSVTLVNKGTMPKLSMGHNWVLLAAGTNLETFVQAAGEAPANDYRPAARQADMLAATKLLGPSERDTVTFDAPSTPGQYTFLCTFPGHYQIGMKGVLIVE